MHPERCQEIEPLLPLHAGGDLEADDARRVAGHLEACGACRARAEGAASAREVLRRALLEGAREPAPDVWPLVRARTYALEAAMAGAGASGGLAAEGPHGALRRASRPAAAAAAVLVAVGLGWLALAGGGGAGDGARRPDAPRAAAPGARAATTGVIAAAADELAPGVRPLAPVRFGEPRLDADLSLLPRPFLVPVAGGEERHVLATDRR